MIIKYCLVCSREFKINLYRLSVAKFCSKKCMDIYHKISERGKNNPNWKGGGVIKDCLQCGRKFRATRSRKDKIIFCSRKCRDTYNRGKQHVHWKSRIKKVCLICGEQFKVLPSDENQKCCSMRCRGKYYSIHYSGKNSPTWSGGGKWPFNIKYKNWIKSVYKRDNYRCKICGSKKKLNAHHIYPKRDYPGLVYDIDNGITLCFEHHKMTYAHEEQYIELLKSLK